MNYFPVKHIKNLLAHKYFYLWLAEFWTLLVAFLCLVSFNKMPSVGLPSADKYVHFTFHLVFVMLWFLYYNSKKPNDKRVLLKVFVASLLFGISIEIAQELFTTTRKGDFFDVLANTSGAILAVAAVVFYKAYFKAKRY